MTDWRATRLFLSPIQAVDWPHGMKSVHHRIQRGGLISAVTESFHPASPHNYAVFLEDDIEVRASLYGSAG